VLRGRVDHLQNQRETKEESHHTEDSVSKRRRRKKRGKKNKEKTKPVGWGRSHL
jgi:hypothetical protein